MGLGMHKTELAVRFVHRQDQSQFGWHWWGGLRMDASRAKLHFTYRYQNALLNGGIAKFWPGISDVLICTFMVRDGVKINSE